MRYHHHCVHTFLSTTPNCKSHETVSITQNENGDNKGIYLLTKRSTRLNQKEHTFWVKRMLLFY